MRRREFIKVIAGSAAAWPLTALAQQSARKIPKIGVLWHAGSAEEEGEYFTSFQQGFRDLGYVEGQTLVFEHRFAAEQYDRFRSLAAELVALKVDVLVAVTRPATAAVQAATATIPIVFITVPDPVGNKFADSLARPGKNLTGLANMAFDVTGKRLELLKEAVPGITRAALLINPNDQVLARRTIEQVQPVARSLNVTIQPFEARTPDEINRAFTRMAQDAVQGVFSGNDPMFFNERRRIADLALVHRLPAMLQNRPGAIAGAFMSYGPDSRIMFRRAATYVDKIVKGEKPGDIPIEQPTKFELLINLKTAKALGIEVSLALLARADEVIE